MKEGRVRWQAVSSTWKRAHIRAQALRLERCLPSFFFFPVVRTDAVFLLQNP